MSLGVEGDLNFQIWVFGFSVWGCNVEGDTHLVLCWIRNLRSRGWSPEGWRSLRLPPAFRRNNTPGLPSSPRPSACLLAAHLGRDAVKRNCARRLSCASLCWGDYLWPVWCWCRITPAPSCVAPSPPVWATVGRAVGFQPHKLIRGFQRSKFFLAAASDVSGQN